MGMSNNRKKSSECDASFDSMDKLIAFRDEHIYPNEEVFSRQVNEGDRWAAVPVVAELQALAREQGLWNLFLPEPEYGAGLSNLEYAPLAEVMGCNEWAPEVFNCGAPDTGNMEVIARYGNEEQKEQWLKPLLTAEIRSCFAMTEPGVASSDATNMEATAVREGDEWVLNGRKWWISGAGDPRCKIAIFMCLTNPEAGRHEQHSQILVPMDAPGVTVVRPLNVFGYDHAPHGHCEIMFDKVRVPYGNVILGEGHGFEIAQGRLGPGRIHHCMRMIGAASRALEMMIDRANTRVAFGRPLIKQQSVREDIALSACQIDQARLLTLKAAQTMDTAGNKGARDLIAMIKIVAPNMALDVIDRAIQLHGAVGLSQDTPLAHMYAYARTLRLADGPDQVHMMQLGRNLARRREV